MTPPGLIITNELVTRLNPIRLCVVDIFPFFCFYEFNWEWVCHMWFHKLFLSCIKNTNALMMMISVCPTKAVNQAEQCWLYSCFNAVSVSEVKFERSSSCLILLGLFPVTHIISNTIHSKSRRRRLRRMMRSPCLIFLNIQNMKIWWQMKEKEFECKTTSSSKICLFLFSGKQREGEGTMSAIHLQKARSHYMIMITWWSPSSAEQHEKCINAISLPSPPPPSYDNDH